MSPSDAAAGDAHCPVLPLEPTSPNAVRVLVVDDSRTMRQALERILAQDYVVRTAIDGQAAIDVFRHYQPDVVLLDINMPRVDGFGVIDYIRRGERATDVFIIVLTAEEAKDVKPKALNMGANDFLLKPFDNVELAARVGVAARQVLLTRDLRRSMAQSRKELAMVSSLQTRLLPRTSPYLQGVQVQSLYRPSGQASGDYYDFFTLDRDHIRLVVADVSGHGARAAFLMAIVRTLFRMSQRHYLGLVETMTAINTHLTEIIGDESDFITAFAADLDFRAKELRYVNAGHCPGLARTGAGVVHRLHATAPLMGFFPIQFSETAIAFEPDDQLFLFTDGFYEWEYNPGELFELDLFLDLAERAFDVEGDYLENLMSVLFGAGQTPPRFRDDLTALWIRAEQDASREAPDG